MHRLSKFFWLGYAFFAAAAFLGLFQFSLVVDASVPLQVSTFTPVPTNTRAPTLTPWPTMTPAPTMEHYTQPTAIPTLTPVATYTPIPTSTIVPITTGGTITDFFGALGFGQRFMSVLCYPGNDVSYCTLPGDYFTYPISHYVALTDSLYYVFVDGGYCDDYLGYTDDIAYLLPGVVPYEIIDPGELFEYSEHHEGCDECDDLSSDFYILFCPENVGIDHSVVYSMAVSGSGGYRVATSISFRALVGDWIDEDEDEFGGVDPECVSGGSAIAGTRDQPFGGSVAGFRAHPSFHISEQWCAATQVGDVYVSATFFPGGEYTYTTSLEDVYTITHSCFSVYSSSAYLNLQYFNPFTEESFLPDSPWRYDLIPGYGYPTEFEQRNYCTDVTCTVLFVRYDGSHHQQYEVPSVFTLSFQNDITTSYEITLAAWSCLDENFDPVDGSTSFLENPIVQDFIGVEKTTVACVPLPYDALEWLYNAFVDVVSIFYDGFSELDFSDVPREVCFVMYALELKNFLSFLQAPGVFLLWVFAAVLAYFFFKDIF